MPEWACLALGTFAFGIISTRWKRRRPIPSLSGVGGHPNVSTRDDVYRFFRLNFFGEKRDTVTLYTVTLDLDRWADVGQ